jgi:hypothetical protein
MEMGYYAPRGRYEESRIPDSANLPDMQYKQEP